MNLVLPDHDFPSSVLHGIDDATLKFGLPSEKGLKYIIHQGLNVISSCFLDGFLDRCFVELWCV